MSCFKEKELKYYIIKKPLEQVWKVFNHGFCYSKYFKNEHIEISSDTCSLKIDTVLKLVVLGKYAFNFKLINKKETKNEKVLIYIIQNESNLLKHKFRQDNYNKACNFKIKFKLRKVTSENSTLITWDYSSDFSVKSECVYTNIKLMFGLLESLILKNDLINSESITVNKNIEVIWKNLLNYRIFNNIKPLHYINVEFEGDLLELGKSIKLEFCNREKYIRNLEGIVITLDIKCGYKKLKISYKLNESNPIINSTAWIVNSINDNMTLMSFIHNINGNYILKSKKRILKEVKKYFEERI